MLNSLTIAVLVLGLIGVSDVQAVDTYHSHNSESKKYHESSKFLIAYDSYQSELLDLINDARENRALSPLRFSNSLSQAAQNHVEDLANNNYVVGHTGTGGSTVVDRTQKVEYSSDFVGENVAAGNKTPEEVFHQWMNSPGHKNNILKPDYTEVGVGYVLNAPDTTYNHYWVLVFGNPNF